MIGYLSESESEQKIDKYGKKYVDRLSTDFDLTFYFFLHSVVKEHHDIRINFDNMASSSEEEHELNVCDDDNINENEIKTEGSSIIYDRHNKENHHEMPSIFPPITYPLVLPFVQPPIKSNGLYLPNLFPYSSPTP